MPMESHKDRVAQRARARISPIAKMVRNREKHTVGSDTFLKMTAVISIPELQRVREGVNCRYSGSNVQSAASGFVRRASTWFGQSLDLTKDSTRSRATGSL